MSRMHPEAVWAVMVTWQPGPDAWENLTALARQVAGVVVVDNGSEPGWGRRLAAGVDSGRVEVVRNAENRGVATALNQGLERARALGAHWVATFDQDSRPAPDFIAGLLGRRDPAAPSDDRVAVLAPIYRDRGDGTLYSAAGAPGPLGAEEREVPVAATSGSIVAVAAWAEVGGFRDDYFIDLVDFEFCLRCRRQGWKVLERPGSVLEHRQGAVERRRFAGRSLTINDYGPARRYFQVRNRLWTYAGSGWREPRWLLQDAGTFGRDFAKLLLVGTARAAKLRAMTLGAWHAVRGRGGPWPG